MIPPSQQLDLGSMTVEDDYQGPRLEGTTHLHEPCQRSDYRIFPV